jgi:hypothetical protein
MVLVFSESASFVRKILQREENKGVEFTGGGAEETRRQKLESRDEEKEVNSRQLKVEGRRRN